MKKGAGVILYSFDDDMDIYILLGKRIYNPGKGSWGIPGGGMEDVDHDDFQSNAIRECFEETEIRIEKPLVEFDRLSFPHLDWRTYIKEVPQDDRKLFKTEMEESDWFLIDKLPAPLVSHLEDELFRLKEFLKIH